MGFQSDNSRVVAGIDGCPSGWIAAVCRIHDGDIGITWERTDQLADFGFLENPRAVALIDIPIGLPDRETPRRACDQAARRALAPGGASRVFSPPARSALAPGLSHPEASARNREEIGLGLSIQAFHILPKIRETDEWIRKESSRIQRLRESHPEVVFRILNVDPLLFSKKRPEGREERAALLSIWLPLTPLLLREADRRFPRSAVAPDDALDALCLLVAALYHTPLRCISSRRDHDACHLPRQILVPAPEKLGKMPHLLADGAGV